MENLSIVYYESLFYAMNVSKIGKVSNIAKPVLLLAILELIEKKYISENKIYYTTELKEEYNHIYREYKKDSIVTPVYYPYYYLKKESFYILNGQINRKTPSDRYIIENIQYAQFDDDLWILLQVKENREKIKTIIKKIIDQYNII